MYRSRASPALLSAPDALLWVRVGGREVNGDTYMVNFWRILWPRRAAAVTEAPVRRNERFNIAALMPWLSGILLTLLLLVPLSILIWLVFFTSIFSVQAIAVIDARPHIAERAQATAEAHIATTPLTRNIFFVNTERLATELTQQIPEVRTIRVTRQLPGTVKILIQEKEPALLFLSGGTYYFVDDQGIAYERARLETLPGEVLPIVKNDDPTSEVTLGIAVVQTNLVQFVLRVAKELPERIHVGVGEIRIPSLAAREVRFLLDNNWELRFDSTRPPDQQLEILQQLLAGTITAEEQAQLEYIDLRIPDRVYYRTRGALPTIAAPAAAP